MSTEAEVQALAAQTALQVVSRLRRTGWTFAALVVYGPKEPSGLAGASFFDVPIAQVSAFAMLSNAVRHVSQQLDDARRLHGSPSDWEDGYLHDLDGGLVDVRALVAAMRDVPVAVLERVAAGFGDLGPELALACRCELTRRRNATVTGAPA